MRRKDPLGPHFAHQATVKRKTGQGAKGPVYAPATAEPAAIDDTTKLVRSATGAEVVSSTSVAFPKMTAYIPAGSLVTLPTSFGGRTSTVIDVQVADGGGLPTPDHLAVSLE
ncbi:hypothetical protein [Rhodococcus opacus]|uniref:hypothetical protein n=1 Tax=Rhodococcus opacus TaxID=37919 RepID=UPI001C483942|nr:hypothetical protein [Rhodococcus opacus]MBV6758358.1 hypothetical protein [Rhodococcus opacus]